MDARDRVTTMADNIPSGGSGSDAMDRLRVAIENHQKATERQTATTRWLNVVMTRSDDLDGSPHRRPDLAHRPLLAFLVVARATSGVADARADRGCAGRREGVGSQAAPRQRPPFLGLALHPGAAGVLQVHSMPLGVPIGAFRRLNTRRRS